MATEIERKFLVNRDGWEELNKPEPLYCAQSYLLNQADRNIRVRIMGTKGFLTIKSRKTAISRLEFEYEIPYDEALELLQLCDKQLVEKNRYLIDYESNTWEVDVFLGQNEGLIVAEIELSSEDQTFAKPDWVTEEVSENPRYYNAQLLLNPFSEWD